MASEPATRTRAASPPDSADGNGHGSPANGASHAGQGQRESNGNTENRPQVAQQTEVEQRTEVEDRAEVKDRAPLQDRESRTPQTPAQPDRAPPDRAPQGKTSNEQHPPNGGHGGEHDEIGSPPPAPHPSKFALIVVVACAVAVFAGLFLFGLLPKLHEESVLAQDAERIKNELPRVSVGTPRQSQAIVEVQLPGDVQALEETTVYPRTSGYLKQWLVDIGDDVKAGQLLAVIDTPDVDQQLDKAKATLNTLQARQITAESDVRLAETTLVRYESLDRDNAVSKLELDQRRSAAETARSALAASKADVAGGKADVDRLTTLQEFSRVYAPFDGTITTRNVEVGQLLTNGNGAAQSLFHIAKTNPVRVFVNVPQIYSPGVKAGLEADLVVREMPDRKFVGKVTRTARAIDPSSRTLLTEVEVPNNDHALLTGSYVQVKIRVARDNPPMLIPPPALVYNAEGTRVAVLDSSHHVHFQPVEVEGDFGNEVGISAGLKPNDQIVTNPGARLADGEEVQIVDPKQTAKEESDKASGTSKSPQSQQPSDAASPKRDE